MDKFQNKYRIPSARLQFWDYCWAGAYFITICTAGREHYFGKIISEKLEISQIGSIADILWHEIPNHSKNVELGAFVVMPNHIHGILILTNTVETLHATSLQSGNSNSNTVETLHATSLQSGNSNSNTAETLQATSLQSGNSNSKNEFMAGISPKSNSISAIIRSYKSAVSKHSHQLGFNFQWQPRFHDRIIRNDDEYQRIVNYINTNPENWKRDKFYKLQKL